MIEILVNVVVGIEALAAVVLVVLSVREYRFLISLKPALAGEFLPLYDALVGRALQISVIGGYLIVLTVIGAFLAAQDMPQLNAIFPPLRAINGAILLVLLSGALQVGRALRALAPN
jgi:hypothetical protein